MGISVSFLISRISSPHREYRVGSPEPERVNIVRFQRQFIVELVNDILERQPFFLLYGFMGCPAELTVDTIVRAGFEGRKVHPQ